MVLSPRSCRMMALLALGLALGMAPSDGPPPPDRIEEDWQVVIASPDPVAVGPQVTTCMNPTSKDGDSFFAFYMNYRDFPSWKAGGLQAMAFGPAAKPGANSPVVDSATAQDNICSDAGRDHHLDPENDV